MQPTIKWYTFNSFFAQWSAGKFGDQRLGQAFINEHIPAKSEPDPELYYCEDIEISVTMIRDKYVDWN